MSMRRRKFISAPVQRKSAKLDKYRAIYDTCKLAYDQTWERLSALDKKAQMFLAVSVLQVTALGFVVNYICSERLTYKLVDMLVVSLACFCIFTCLFSVLWFVFVLKIRKDFRSYADPDFILKEFIREDELELLESLSERFADDRNFNEEICEAKAQKISNGTVCIVASFILLGVMFLLVIIREAFGGMRF